MFAQSAVVLAIFAFASSAVAQDTSTQYLPNIVNAATNTTCQATCQPFENAITACVNQFSSNSALAQCSCQTAFLGQLSACAACEDSISMGTTFGAANYTGFCNQCITVGFQPAGACTAPIAAASTTAPVVPASTQSSIILPTATITGSANSVTVGLGSLAVAALAALVL